MSLPLRRPKNSSDNVEPEQQVTSEPVAPAQPVVEDETTVSPDELAELLPPEVEEAPAFRLPRRAAAPSPQPLPDLTPAPQPLLSSEDIDDDELDRIISSHTQNFQNSTEPVPLDVTEPAVEENAPRLTREMADEDIAPLDVVAPRLSSNASESLPALPERTQPPVAQEAPKVAPEPTPVTTAPVQLPTTPPPAAARRANLPTVQEENLNENQKMNRYLHSLPTDVRRSLDELLTLLCNDESSEIVMNGPNLIGFKSNGQRFFNNNIDFGDVETYHDIINNVLLPMTNTLDRIGTTRYLIEGQLVLPDPKDSDAPPIVGRLHIIAPPAVQAAVVTIAKKSRKKYTVDTLQASGSMSRPMAELLKRLAKGRVTMVMSGVSGSGKTTLLEALSREFDVNDRIVLVEDTAELSLPVSDFVPLLSSQTRPGDDPREAVTLEWLVKQANRMRPDRIIVGEVRGAEMDEFLTAANSGADGSMTTVHASSPEQTLNKIVSLSMKSATSKSENAIWRDIASSVQVIVQMTLIDGKHVISHITEVSNNVLSKGSGIAMQPLFLYDRNTGEFRADSRPSDDLKSFLAQRGVDLPNFAPSNTLGNY